jgi:curli biogenesis system outer membrane secretion channel CsgG
MRSQIALILILSVSSLYAQAPAAATAPAAAAKKAAPKAAAVATKTATKTAVKTSANPMAKIIQMIELKLPDSAVLNAIQGAGKLNPSPDDYIKLKQAGASDAVFAALAGGGSAAPAAAAVAVKATPVAAPAALSINTDFSTLACTRSASSAKRVLAIDEFDYGTVTTSVAAIFGTQVNVGKGILALFTKRLAEEGKYRIVERQKLGKVLGEQDLGASNRVKQGTNAKIGRVQGADAILMGTITVFGYDTRNNRVNAGAASGGRLGGFLGGVSIGKKSDKAIVEISYRLVDAETSEVIAVGEARGESKRTSSGIGMAGYGGGVGAGGGVDMSSSNFQETVIGEATVDCVTKLAAIANSKEQQVAQRNSDVEGKIAEIAGNKVYVAVGSNDGVQQCDKFEVSRVIKEIKDPSTGEVLDLQVEKVGELMVTEVRDKISIAFFNGSAAPKVGYVVKKIQ